MKSAVMRSLRRWSAFAACMLLMSVTHAAPSVVDYQLISKKISGRTTVDYSYRVRISNDDAALVDVVGTVASSSVRTKVISDTVTFGSVAAGGQAISINAITIRQDRTQPFKAAALTWKFAWSSEDDDQLPPDPGPAGDATIEGIDSNSNGIRDDVERKVLTSYAPGPTREALLSLARHLGDVIVHGSDKDVAYNGTVAVTRNIECLYALEPANARKLFQELLADMANTSARVRAYYQYGDSLRGRTVTLRRPWEFAESCPD